MADEPTDDAPAPAAPATDDSWGSGDAPAPTGQAYLSTLDPGRAAMVKAIGDGKMTLPKATSRGGVVNPQTQALIADVAQYNPGFDDADAPSRIAARKAFTSGKQGQNITSFNTALDHLSYLDQAVTGLGNVQSPIPGTTHLVNAVRNGFRNNDGDTSVSNFNAAVPNVLDELVKAVRGTGGNEADIARLQNAFNTSQSPEQQRGVIQQWAQQLNGRINEIRNSYHTAIGTTAEDVPGISQDAQAHLQAFLSPNYVAKGASGIGGMAVAPPPADGTPPGPGGAPPSGPPGTPPSPPPDAGGTPPIAISADGSSNFQTPDDVAFTAAARALLANPKSTRADFDALAAQHNRPAFDKNLDTALQMRDNGAVPGVGVSIGDSVTGHKDATTLGKIAATAPGAAVIEGANSAMLDTLPKVQAGVSALGSRLTGDNRDLGDIYDTNLAENNARMDALDEAHPLAALGGQVGGFLAGDKILGSGIKAGLDALPAGVSALGRYIPTAARPALQDAAYGAAYGAGGSDSLADVPSNAIGGGLMAALGGTIGRGVVKGGAALASPVANDAVRRLTDAGVTLTPGQILGAGGGIVGRTVKGIEDRAAGFPIIGDVINNARRGGVEDFNRAAINDALAPIGETASDVGHAGVADAQQKVSDAYTSALSKMSAVPDQAFTDDLRDVGKQVQTLSPSHREQFTNIVDTDLQPYLNGKSQLSGSDLQSIKQGLDSRIANLQGQGSSPQDRDLADRLSDVRDAVLNLAGRTDPASAQDFHKANQAYAMLSRVNGAAAKSKDGVFTPNQFRQAVTKRGYGTSTNNVATGSALMQQLSTDASDVLPSSVPDSGTAGRAALGLVAGKVLGAGAPGAALGGVAGYEQGGLTGALTGAGLGALAFSRPGLRAGQKFLAGSRGKTLNTLGDILRANSSLGGAVGVPLLLQDRSK